ncbi:VIR protein [Plasmodium vivax]|uniref:VIR protein n=1 Tax=Plasmodium vivax TaxID=5855 RepID=A0A1G4GSG7_PLAVI|nr:VIR protein [Plasmodium vivax]
MSKDASDFHKYAKDSQLKDSDTYKKYELLDKNACDNSDKFPECKSSENSSGSIDKNIAAKIKRNIDYLKSINNAKEYRITCLYYKYWMYEQIKNAINSEEKKKNVGAIIDKFVNFHKEHMKNEPPKAVCEYQFIHKNLPELTYFIEQKHLHNYFVNYENIKKESTCNQITSQKYREYLQSISDLYIQHKKECCDEYGMNDCPNYFNCYEGYNPNNILSALQHSDNCNNLKKLNEDKDKQSASDDSNSTNSIVTTVWCTKIYHPVDKSLVFYSCEVPKSVENDKVKFVASSYGEKKIHNKRKSCSSKKSRDRVVSKEPRIQVIKNGEKCSSEEVASDEKSKTCTNIEEKTEAQSTSDQSDSVMMTSTANSSTGNVPSDRNALGTNNSRVDCKDMNSNTCIILKNLFQPKNQAVKINSVETITTDDITRTDEMLPECDDDSEDGWETSSDKLDNVPHHSSSTIEDISNMLTNSIFRIILCSVLLFGTLFIFFLYYKYTPIGYWLRSKMTKKKYTQASVRRELQNRQETYDPRSKNINHKRKRINIVYQQT